MSERIHVQALNAARIEVPKAGLRAQQLREQILAAHSADDRTLLRELRSEYRSLNAAGERVRSISAAPAIAVQQRATRGPGRELRSATLGGLVLSWDHWSLDEVDAAGRMAWTRFTRTAFARQFGPAGVLAEPEKIILDAAHDGVRLGSFRRLALQPDGIYGLAAVEREDLAEGIIRSVHSAEAGAIRGFSAKARVLEAVPTAPRQGRPAWLVTEALLESVGLATEPDDLRCRIRVAGGRAVFDRRGLEWGRQIFSG